MMDSTYFAQAVAYYRANRPYFYAFVRPYELTLLHGMTPEFQRPILDLGCGDGFFARFLSELAPIDYGVDYDPAVLSEARQVYAQVLRSDTTTIPLPDGAARTIFSNSVFEHLRQPAIMLGELARILQPGGKLYATVTTAQWEEALAGVRYFGAPYRAWFRKIQRHYAWLTCDEWHALFQQAGLRVNRMIGYLDQRHVRAIEAYHYLSFPVFLAKVMAGKWENPLTRPLNSVLALISRPTLSEAATDLSTAPCVFFEVEKPICV